MDQSTAPSLLAVPPRRPLTVQPRRQPRDAQRSRVYLAETPLPSSPLPGLDACASYVDRVVGTFWWQERFPDRDLASVPRMRPGQGARQAFFRVEDTGPTITLPRRYRTKGVVLHELTHWALGIDSGLPHHGRTFARVLLDATAEFWGADHAAVLAASYREQRVHVGKAPRRGPDGRLRYGWDERLRLGKGHVLTVAHTAHDDTGNTVTGRFVGYERGASVLRLACDDDSIVRLPTSKVWDVRDD